MTRTPPHRPELLAPAGDWVALRAAVANGADAVYFGLSQFNARARAANFTPDELPDVVRFLHTRNVRGFVTLNTLIFSDELPEAARLVAAVAASGRARQLRVIAHELTGPTRRGLATGAIDVVLDQNPDGEIREAITAARSIALGQGGAVASGPIEIGIFLRDNLR